MKQKCTHRYKNGQLARQFNNLQFGEIFISCCLCGERIDKIFEEENEKERKKYEKKK